MSRGSTQSLEGLIQSLVPSLAPPRRRPSGSGRNSAGSRPHSGLGYDSPSGELEKERKEKLEELVEFCKEILASRSSSSASELNSLPENARRLLARADGGDGSDQALRFGGSYAKLEKGKTLASPLPHLKFLLALSKLDPTNQSERHTPFDSQPVASSSRTPLFEESTNIPFDVKGKSKADVLKSWRSSRARPPFSDELLLRDTLYLLQGIDGRYVKFARLPPAELNPYRSEQAQNNNGAGFPLSKGPEVQKDAGEIVGIEILADETKHGYISTPTRSVLAQISELGVMYRKVTDFIQSRPAGTSKGGMTEQSLCHFLHHELSEYHRLLAVLESQLSQEANDGALTLLRLGLWTEDMKLKLRMMTRIVDDAKVTHGGALVSKIHAHTSHGDPFVRQWMDQLLEDVSKPFFATLAKWIFSGDLHDPFQEFFVQLNPDPTLREGQTRLYGGDEGFEGGLDGVGVNEEAGRVWEKKYIYVRDMVPGFVSEDFGKKIFSTGRSLNFIRYNCHDSDWIETQAELANAGRALKYSDLAGLERSIVDAYSIASDRLRETFFEKFRLLDHLRALKSYLLLGAGDFAELLMEALAPRLNKPANSLYRHHLTSDLESALRGSNAQYDSPDILRRLDARILEYTHGELGWDCFALEYKVEAPLNAVLDSRAMVEYDRVFHHLWRIKRVEVLLTSGWMRVVSGARLFERIPGLNHDWHHSRIVHAEMVHFLRQLQAFYQLEVVECSWSALMEFTDKRSGDLDSLIHAHRTYLDRVVRKILLLGGKRDKEEILLGFVQDALEYIIQFRVAADDLYAWSLAEATRLDSLRDDARGLASAHISPEAEDRHRDQADAIRNRVKSAAHAFQDRVVSVCHLAGSHQDLDIRFLGVRIAFNGFYALKRPSGKSRSVRSGAEGR